jgi:hypothetical protein
MKNCSQFLILFILAAVVGFLFYNQSKVNQMKEQVDAISSRFKVGKSSSSGKQDIVTPIIGARKHAMQAKALLKAGNKKAAQAEIDEVIASLDTADNVSKDIVGQIGDMAGKAREKLTSAYQQAVKDISTQMKSQTKTDEKKDKK